MFESFIFKEEWKIQKNGQIEKGRKIQNSHILKFLNLPFFSIEKDGGFRVTPLNMRMVT